MVFALDRSPVCRLSLVTHWTFRAFGMGPDEGAILLGNMDTRTKLERIKALYKHIGAGDLASLIADLLKDHKEHVEVRNAICHKACGGHTRSDPDRIIFSSAKTVHQQPGRLLVELIHIDQFRAAIAFANARSEAIIKIVEGLITLRQPPREPSPDSPSSSPPNRSPD